jgi:hypothetical protein
MTALKMMMFLTIACLIGVGILWGITQYPLNNQVMKITVREKDISELSIIDTDGVFYKVNDPSIWAKFEVGKDYLIKAGKTLEGRTVITEVSPIIMWGDKKDI